MFRKIFLTILVAGLAFPAVADDKSLAYKGITEFSTLAGGSVASGDFFPVYDASARDMVKVDGATLGAILGGAFNGTVGATTPAAGTFTTLQANTSLKVSSSGTAITKVLKSTDAVASGQTSKAVTLTGVTTASDCLATANEVATNAVYIRAAVATTDTVTVTVSGDPGASNLDFTVVCFD